MSSVFTAGSPTRNPQSAEGPSALQSASIRNPPCVQRKITHEFEPGTARAHERPQHRSKEIPR
eukprot:1850377-Alexandrium_andersonii.AAC.1